MAEDLSDTVILGTRNGIVRAPCHEMKSEMLLQIGHIRSGLAIAASHIAMASGLGISFDSLIAEMDAVKELAELKMRDITRVHY